MVKLKMIKGKFLRGEEYQTKFDSKVFLKSCYNSPEESNELMKFAFKTHKEIFSSGNIRGNRIIDIGCGPSICGLIPAAKWFEELYLAEYSKNNRDELRKWLERETGAHNWEPFFRYFARDDCHGETLEGNENDFRSKLKCVLECDFHKSSPLDPENLGQFDAVISSLALESGCYEIITYKQAMKNVVSLLKPGGYLILYTSLNERFYSAGEMFEVLPLSSDDVKESLCEAGIDVLQIYENIYTDRTHNDGSIMIVGQKKY